MRIRNLLEENAATLAAIITDDDSPDHIRIEALNKLLEARKENTFFKTMFKEHLSYGKCPHCSFETYWLIPEDELNRLGWVSAQKDPRVKPHTTKDDCAQYQESCSKKRIVF